jgi:dihydrofolate reductase
MLNLIFCVDSSGLFGRNNNLPWNFKEDLKYFKDMTTNFNRIDDSNNIIVMGSNTWNSIKKKLPNRTNIVISSNQLSNIKVSGSDKPDHIFKTFDIFMENCKKGKLFYNKNIFVIGGKKLFSYVILKYNKFIKHVFINIIEHSFPQFINDVVLKIYSFHNFELNRLSYTSIYSKNTIDNKYYYIKFNQYINKNFNMNDVLNYINTDNKNINIKTVINNEHNHNQYTILEEMQDVTLNYCEDCESIVKNKNSKLCNDCLSSKCKCLFC